MIGLVDHAGDIRAADEVELPADEDGGSRAAGDGQIGAGGPGVGERVIFPDVR